MQKVQKALSNALESGKLVAYAKGFNDVAVNQKVYLMMSAVFYVFSIYQNILVCIRFHHNMKTIHNHFEDIQLDVFLSLL